MVEMCNIFLCVICIFPNNSSDGIAMWNGKHCALLSSKDNAEPYDFIEMVMRDMEEGDIVVLFSKADYEAQKDVSITSRQKNSR